MNIPDAKKAGVERALQATFGAAGVESLSLLSGGLSGAGVYRLRIGGADYLMRLDVPADAFRNPSRWYGCMRIAAHADLAPRVLYAAAEDGVAITEFVVARTLAIGQAGERGEMVEALGRIVRSLHGAPAFPPLFDYLDLVDVMVNAFCERGLIAPAATEPHLARYADLASAYRGLARDDVPSHNDLTPRNILDDGRRLWLIDWESAFQADRYVDLATLTNFFSLDGAETRRLVEVYFDGEASMARRSRLFLARQIVRVNYAMTFLNAAAALRPDLRLPQESLEAPSLVEVRAAIAEGRFGLDSFEGKLAFGKAQLQTALENLESPNYAAALAAAI